MVSNGVTVEFDQINSAQNRKQTIHRDSNHISAYILWLENVCCRFSYDKKKCSERD